MTYRPGTGMSLTFFYSVLLLFAFFNPSKHHLHLIRFPFLVFFFKFFFLSCFHFLSFRLNSVEFFIFTNMRRLMSIFFIPPCRFCYNYSNCFDLFFLFQTFLLCYIYSLAGFIVPIARAIVISFSFPNSPSFGLTFLFIGVGEGGGGADGCPVAWYFVRPNGRKPVWMVLAAYVPLLLR